MPRQSIVPREYLSAICANPLHGTQVDGRYVLPKVSVERLRGATARSRLPLADAAVSRVPVSMAREVMFFEVSVDSRS